MKHIPEKDLAVMIKNKFLFERYGKVRWVSLVQAYQYYREILAQDRFLGEYKPRSKDSFATLMCEFSKEYDWLRKEKRGIHVYYAVVNPADTNKEKGTLCQKAAKFFNWKNNHSYVI